jgi:hypothetical protein
VKKDEEQRSECSYHCKVDEGFQVSGYELRVKDVKNKGFKFRVAGCGLRMSRIRVSSFGLRVQNH